MVDGYYTAFYKVKSAAEALDFELWRSRRKTPTTGTASGWHATKYATGTASESAPIHGKETRYPTPVNSKGTVINCHKWVRKGIDLRICVLVVKHPDTWIALVQARANTGERHMRKTNPPGGIVQKESEEPGVDRCGELTAGSETGVRRDIPSIGMDL
jgi:hypothetical protein